VARIKNVKNVFYIYAVVNTHARLSRRSPQQSPRINTKVCSFDRICYIGHASATFIELDVNIDNVKEINKQRRFNQLISMQS